MKVLITSPDALIDKSNGEFFPEIIDVLRTLEKDGLIEGTIVVSSHAEKLYKIPDDLHPIAVGSKSKRGTDFVEELKQNVPEISDFNDLLVLGANDSDFYMSANSKLLLLSACYAKKNNPGCKVFKPEYGIHVDNPSELLSLLQRFGRVDDSLFFELEVSEQTTVYSLISSNYKYENDDDLRTLKTRMESFLKQYSHVYKGPFFQFFIFSLYFKIPELREVNYWCVYPSSGKGVFNQEVTQLKEATRKIFKSSSSTPPILERNKDAQKRTFIDKAKRLELACDNQLETIHLNPHFKDRLKGKTVCVLDDFTTYGTSCETVRALLEPEGVKKIYFITIGKFGREYIKYSYTIEGDKYEPQGFSYKKIGEAISLKGTFNYYSDKELKKVLGDIL